MRNCFSASSVGVEDDVTIFPSELLRLSSRKMRCIHGLPQWKILAAPRQTFEVKSLSPETLAPQGFGVIYVSKSLITSGYCFRVQRKVKTSHK